MPSKGKRQVNQDFRDLFRIFKEFEAKYLMGNRLRSSYGGESINIIGINDLIQAKRAMDREQDRLDLKSLEQAKGIK